MWGWGATFFHEAHQIFLEILGTVHQKGDFDWGKTDVKHTTYSLFDSVGQREHRRVQTIHNSGMLTLEVVLQPMKELLELQQLPETIFLKTLDICRKGWDLCNGSEGHGWLVKVDMNMAVFWEAVRVYDIVSFTVVPTTASNGRPMAN